MNENVVIFPTRKPIEGDQESRRDQQRQHDLLRLKQIEEARGEGKKGHILRSLHDRIAAAVVTGRMIEHAQAQSVSISEIQDRFGGRIDRYRLIGATDVASPATRARADRNLMQRASGYIRLAEVIAELCGTNPDEAKIEVLRGTSLWNRRVAVAGHEESDERAANLSLLLNEMTRAVARDAKLSELFSRAKKIPGVWDLHNRRFSPSTMACLFQDRYADWYEHWSEAPPLPSVALLEIGHVEVTDLPILVSTTPTEGGSLDLVRGDQEDFSLHRNISVRLSRQIRLAIGPASAMTETEALFESRASTEIRLLDGQTDYASALYPSCDLWTVLNHGGLLSIDDEWHLFKPVDQIELGSYESWPFTPLGADTSEYEHHFLSWNAVTPEYVTHWLDRNDVRVLADVSGARPVPTEFWFPRGVAAHDVERALATGALETAMLAEIEHIRRALDERERIWRAGASASSSALIQAWAPKDDPE